MFDTLSKHSPMYQCLVSGCNLFFHNSKKRKKHLIDVHKYPSSFRFERLISSTTKSKPVISNSANTAEENSMDVGAESSDRGANSRFKYTYKVPATFSFGQGVQKSFVRKNPKRRTRGNHLVKSNADVMERNMEDIDMSELITSLDS
ncbi:ZNF511 [Bugula neritina]|uniref:ZNF511 n=1 Tax=Bugula neritina TaxID=10212 RepID=A0A7J7JKN0_BUGNE|nr:ZNF511 [Bugula neritina]